MLPSRSSGLLALGLIAALGAPVSAQTGPLSTDLQIRLAVHAAPAELRDGVMVQGYDADGEFVTLREGSNDLICMAPAPAREELEVSCHHLGLEQYWERGRELIAQGITGNERTQARWDEFAAGTLPIPTGSINYIMTFEDFDRTSGEIEGSFLRWVVYTPNATTETSGISSRPAAPGAPWLMFPGTPGSHIMIVPPRGG